MTFDWQKYAMELQAELGTAQEELRQLKRESDGLAEEFRQEFGMTPQQSRICARLMQSLGNVVPYEFLIVAMNSEDTEDPRRTLYVQLFTIRSKLKESGLKIETDHGVGLRMIRAGSNAPTGTGAGANYPIKKPHEPETERKDP